MRILIKAYADGTLRKSGKKWQYFSKGKWRNLCAAKEFALNRDLEKARALQTSFSPEEVKARGMRWVTIRGARVLLQGTEDGGYVVVGGAGGKLNHFKVDKILDQDKYEERRKERLKVQEGKQYEHTKKVQTGEAQEFTMQRTKKEARIMAMKKKVLRETKAELVRTFVEHVSSVLGHPTKEAMVDSVLGEGTVEDIREKFTRDWEEGSGGKGRGGGGGGGDFDGIPASVEAKIDAAITKEAKRIADDAISEARDKVTREYTGEAIKDVSHKIGEEMVEGYVDIGTEIQLITARHKLYELQKELRKADVDTDTLKVGDAFAGDIEVPMEKIQQEIQQSIETAKNVRFYDEINPHMDKISKYMDQGAARALNGALSDLYEGGSFFNEDLVRELGIEAVSRAIAQKLHDDDKSDVALKALRSFSESIREKTVDEAMNAADNAYRDRDRIMDNSQGEEPLYSEIQARALSMRHLGLAYNELGSAAGSLRAMAHLINAIEDPPNDTLSIDLGPNEEKAMRRMQRSGFDKGKFRLRKGSDNHFHAEFQSTELVPFFEKNKQKLEHDNHLDAIKRHAANDGTQAEGMKSKWGYNPASKSFESDIAKAQEAGYRFASEVDKSLLAFSAGIGKEQPLDASILTTNGWKSMGEMTPGQMVFDETGTPSTVSGVFPQGMKPIYRVTFSDGSSTECGLDHLWRLRAANDSDWRVVPLRYIVEGGSNDTGRPKRAMNLLTGGRRNYRIPVTEAVAFSEKDFQIDPYLLGVLIGDGGLTQAIVLSSGDRYILDRASELAPEGVSLKHRSAYDYAFTAIRRGERNELLASIRSLGLYGLKSAQKFIPSDYLFGSVGQRLALLRGLMDTDGYVSRNGRTTQYTTVSSSLSRSVLHLVRSLGGTASVQEKLHPNGIGYTLNINLGVECPFSLPRKVSRWKPKTKYGPSRYIDKIEYVGEKEAQCIMVESIWHTYLTDDFVVTHNTYVTANLLTDAMQKGAKKILVVVPANLKQQTAEDGYKKFCPDDVAAQVKWADEKMSPANRRASYDEDGIHVISQNALENDSEWLQKQGFDMVVIDEVHQLINAQEGGGKVSKDGTEVPGSKSYRSLEQITAKTKKVVAMTGTPIKTNKVESYKIASLLGKSEELGTMKEFEKRHKDINQTTNAFTASEMDAFRKEQAPWVYEQHYKLAVKKTNDKVSVKSSPGQRKRYKEIMTKYRTDTEAKIKGAASNRDVDLWRAANLEGGADNPKVKELVRQLDTMPAGERALVFLSQGPTVSASKEYAGNLNSIKGSGFTEVEKDSRGRVIKDSRYAVDVSSDTDRKVVGEMKKVINGTADEALMAKYPNLKVLVATDALATGHNITGATTVFKVDTPMSQAQDDQQTARSFRNGQTRDVKVVYFEGDDPNDINKRYNLRRKGRESQLMGNPSSVGIAGDDSGFGAYLRQAEMDQHGVKNGRTIQQDVA